MNWQKTVLLRLFKVSGFYIFKMLKDLEAIKKKRKFRKSVTDTLKLIHKGLSQQDNNARVQVLIER